jgi:hypothetical protein
VAGAPAAQLPSLTLIAAMRKLLILLNSIVREKKCWKEFIVEKA